MDPLLIEVLRFGTAILAGGVVAVIAQRLAFDHARRLQLDERTQRDAAARRALIAEMGENLRHTDVSDGRLPARVVRSAWDAARDVELSEGVRLLIADAYRAAGRMNESLDLFRVTYAALSTFEDDQLALTRQSQLGRSTRAIAEEAHGAFAKACDALRPVTAPQG